MSEQITDETVVRRLVASFPNWYHRIEVWPGVVTPGVNDSPGCLALLDLPADMRGLRVLDIGTRDGYFAFECERRGAEVVAIDHARIELTGFPIAKKLLGSKVEWIRDNVYNVTPEKYGFFDIVLFLGVLYHLRDPLRAIDLIRGVCRGELILETQVIDNYLLLPSGEPAPLAAVNPVLTDVPLMQFYPRNTLKQAYTNYWGPNMRCVEMMLEEANFHVASKKLNGERGIFRCTLNTDLYLEYLKQMNRTVY